MKHAQAWAAAVASYLAGLATLVGGFYGLSQLFPSLNPLLIASLASIPLFCAFVTITLPQQLAARRDRAVRDYGVKGTLHDPRFFRVRPYLPEERDRFVRPDNSHLDALEWVRRSSSRLLYLTGLSGTGKTSLLNAFIIPNLEEEHPPCLTLLVRPYDDAVTKTRAFLASHTSSERFLIIIDQFEEIMIDLDSGRSRSLINFVLDVAHGEEPGPALIVVLRSDYIGAITKLGLPPLHQHANWFKVSPFTERAALEFFGRSGLELGDNLRRQLLAEAAKLEETAGFIRPITLNMLGLVLGRFAEAIPRSVRGGQVLQTYLVEALERADIRNHTHPIVRKLVVLESGMKRPCSETEISRDTGIDVDLVRGTLVILANYGLTRQLRDDVWEVSHDFIARMLANVVSGWHVPIWQRIRPWLAPTLTGVWFLLFAFVWIDNRSVSVDDAISIVVTCSAGADLTLTGSDIAAMQEAIEQDSPLPADFVLQLRAPLWQLLPEEDRLEAYQLFRECAYELSDKSRLRRIFSFPEAIPTGDRAPG